MKAKKVNEFKRGQDMKKSLNVGKYRNPPEQEDVDVVIDELFFLWDELTEEPGRMSVSRYYEGDGTVFEVDARGEWRLYSTEFYRMAWRELVKSGLKFDIRYHAKGRFDIYVWPKWRTGEPPLNIFDAKRLGFE